MPLLSSLALAGNNTQIIGDYFVAESQLAAMTSAAGGDVNTNADFREQVMTVIADSTDIVPIAEGDPQTKADATVTNPKFPVNLWPTWRAVTEQTNANTDPVALAQQTVNAVAPRFPISIDKYFFDAIIAGANVTEIVFDPAAGVASLKSLLADFTTTSYAADGFVMTRLGTNELGWNVDGDSHRMDLTQSTGIRTGETGAALADLGLNSVLGVVGPFGQSNLAMSGGLQMSVHPDATIDGKGPENGYVNHRAMMALGWGNAQCSTALGAIDGAGFSVLTIAPAA